MKKQATWNCPIRIVYGSDGILMYVRRVGHDLGVPSGKEGAGAGHGAWSGVHVGLYPLPEGVTREPGLLGRGISGEYPRKKMLS